MEWSELSVDMGKPQVVTLAPKGVECCEPGLASAGTAGLETAVYHRRRGPTFFHRQRFTGSELGTAGNDCRSQGFAMRLTDRRWTAGTALKMSIPKRSIGYTNRASLAAIALIVTGAPSLVLKRRNCAPR